MKTETVAMIRLVVMMLGFPIFMNKVSKEAALAWLAAFAVNFILLMLTGKP